MRKSYEVLEEKILYNGFLSIKKGKVRHDRQIKDGSLMIEHESMERGDATAILLYESDTNHILLTRQFRYPTTAHNVGWIDEIVAGNIAAGEAPENAIIREVNEEIGYRIHDPELIATFYSSPGGTSERIFLYYAEVVSSDKTSAGGGHALEDEDILLIKIPEDEINHFLNDGRTHDAKTIIALQWFLLRQV